MTIPLGGSQSWTAVVVNHLWQSTLSVGIAWLLAVALKKNCARARYWVWFAASLKFLLPFSFLIAGGGWLRSLLHVAAMEQPRAAQVMEQVAQPFAEVHHPGVGVSVGVHQVNWLSWILFAVWASGAAVVATRFAWSWWRAHQAKRAATRVDLATDVPVFASTAMMEPGVFGIVRPVLLLPTGILERLTAEQLQAIVAHEMCHVRNRDNLTFAIHMTVTTLFWFYPPVWWIRTRLIEERELACDEAVLLTGSAADVYAQSIINVCKFHIESPLACTSGVTGADLNKRIMRILAGYSVRQIGWSRKLLLASAGAVVLFLPTCFGLLHTTRTWAQTVTMPSRELPGFEVATVKPSMPDGTMVMTKLTPDGVQIKNAPLIFILHLAAGFLNATDDQIIGVPSWVKTEKYDIDAKVGESDIPKLDKLSRVERNEMMLSLLADRFGLAVHWETRELPEYDLVVASGGSKLSEAKPGDTYPNGLKDDQGQTTPGMVRVGLGTMDCQAIPIANLLEILSELSGRTVVDKTGLTGKYDIKLRWRPDGSSANPDAGGGSAEESEPNFFAAIGEQLGLRLVPAKGPVRVLVVDHIEKPSPN